MSDFYQKTLTNVPNFTIAPADMAPAHPYKRVQTLAGNTLNMPLVQVPTRNTGRISNLWRYYGQGLYTTVLQTGGQVNIKIDRGSGSGRVKAAWLRCVVQNPSSNTNLFMTPTPLWIQQIQYQTPDGATISQNDGSFQWLSTVLNYDQDTWYDAQKYLLSDDVYQTGLPLLPQQNTIVYIPLIGSWLEAASFLVPAVDGDQQIYITFQPQTNNVIFPVGATAANLVQLSLDVEMEQMRPEEMSAAISGLRSIRTDYVIPYPRTQRFQMALNAGQQVQLPLTGIKGDVVFSWFTVRYGDSSGLNGQNQMINYPVASFQYQNSEGIGISGQQFVDSAWNRYVEFPRQYPGTFSSQQHVYGHNFCESDGAPLALLRQGHKMGAYPFTTNESLVINTAPLGVNEVWTVTASGVPASGHMIFQWNTPYVTATTPPFSATSTSAQIATAITALLNFEGNVTVASTGDGGTNGFTGSSHAITLTFSGGYGCRPISGQGFSFAFFATDAATSAPAAVSFTWSLTTAG